MCIELVPFEYLNCKGVRFQNRLVRWDTQGGRCGEYSNKSIAVIAKDHGFNRFSRYSGDIRRVAADSVWVCRVYLMSLLGKSLTTISKRDTLPELVLRRRKKVGNDPQEPQEI